ncbi:uncharacterized protein F4807DRAFT_172086 [Annulohypoxylon truncatum]|uniref:uncharacterized protein n=1 Tax=Annulohypoxylon truncatum TaxID=327061 RepID=UPI0020076BA9|nr:uncharacterized protein F4807DRAFT_172086 [Annulohypoxylon truncatum]KAI1207588.1 hypothetical protein F4807DRAFT_172086 [Annulohypoxylon truncatum]
MLRGGWLPSMEIAVGGKIEQNIVEDDTDPTRWMKDQTITVPVQILNSTAYRRVTGEDPPPSPIDASTYAEAGLPFFELWEEPSSVAGDFEGVKSVNQIEQDRGLAQGSEAPVHPRIVELNNRSDITIPNRHAMLIDDPDGLMNPAGPLRKFRTVADMMRDLEI